MTSPPALILSSMACAVVAIVAAVAGSATDSGAALGIAGVAAAAGVGLFAAYRKVLPPPRRPVPAPVASERPELPAPAPPDAKEDLPESEASTSVPPSDPVWPAPTPKAAGTDQPEGDSEDAKDAGDDVDGHPGPSSSVSVWQPPKPSTAASPPSSKPHRAVSPVTPTAVLVDHTDVELVPMRREAALPASFAPTVRRAVLVTTLTAMAAIIGAGWRRLTR